jgi:hypothetical protein
VCGSAATRVHACWQHCGTRPGWADRVLRRAQLLRALGPLVTAPSSPCPRLLLTVHGARACRLCRVCRRLRPRWSSRARSTSGPTRTSPPSCPPPPRPRSTYTSTYVHARTRTCSARGVVRHVSVGLQPPPRPHSTCTRTHTHTRVMCTHPHAPVHALRASAALQPRTHLCAHSVRRLHTRRLPTCFGGLHNRAAMRTAAGDRAATLPC